MNFVSIFDNLPDAVCVVDELGLILESNRCFKKTITKSVAAINFPSDVLHQQHQHEYCAVVERMVSDRLTGNEEPSSLGVMRTFTMSVKSQQFPVYRPIEWSISSLDESTFILSGRDSSQSEDLLKLDSLDTKCIFGSADPSLTQSVTVPKTDHPYEDMGAELVDFFQNAPIALHWLSGTGIIMWANDSELQSLGYSADEYIGHCITEFLMPGEELHLQEVLGNLAAGRTIHDKPFRFRAKNGDVKYLIVDSNVNFNEDGSFRHTRCFIRNDTDRRVKEEILTASNRIMAEEADAKSAFIRHVFHEMRTPLHVLSTFLNSTSPSAEDFEEMRHHTDSTLALVDDLTFATTFEAGKMQPSSPLQVHLPSLLQAAIKAVNAVEQRGGRAVGIRLRSEGLVGEAENRLVDPCLSRVVYNLLSNAVRYSPAAGQYVTLTVTYNAQSSAQSSSNSSSSSSLRSKRTRSASFEENMKCANNDEQNGSDVNTGAVTFHFENSTTSPMDVALVRNYFSYYYHSDFTALSDESMELRPEAEQVLMSGSGHQTPNLSTTSSESDVRSPLRLKSSSIYKDLNSVKGLGLGLYTAYSMVKLMGGQLQCSADTPNKACFWFTVTLPSCPTAVATADKPPPEMLSVEAEPLAEPDNGAICDTLIEIQRQMRVLVVDDSSTCQKVIAKSLKGLEFQIEVASNGWEACEKLQHTPCQFDAVLMDLRMPVMDGLEATRYCREVLKLLSLPIIAITAEIGSSIREEAIKAGASHFLSKPAKAQEIISILRSLDAHTLPCTKWPGSHPSPTRGLSCV